MLGQVNITNNGRIVSFVGGGFQEYFKFDEVCSSVATTNSFHLDFVNGKTIGLEIANATTILQNLCETLVKTKPSGDFVLGDVDGLPHHLINLSNAVEITRHSCSVKVCFPATFLELSFHDQKEADERFDKWSSLLVKKDKKKLIY